MFGFNKYPNNHLRMFTNVDFENLGVAKYINTKLIHDLTF